VPGTELGGIYQACRSSSKRIWGTAADHPLIPVEDKRVIVLAAAIPRWIACAPPFAAAPRGALPLRPRFREHARSRKEYKNAIEEGAQFSFLTNPIELIGDAAGQVKEIRCVRMELGDPDENGRRKPRPIPGSEFTVAATSSWWLMVSIGCFFPENDLSRVRVTNGAALWVDKNLMTSIPGVSPGRPDARRNLPVLLVRDGRQAARHSRLPAIAGSGDAISPSGVDWHWRSSPPGQLASSPFPPEFAVRPAPKLPLSHG